METIDLKTYKPRNGWVLIYPLLKGIEAHIETSLGFKLDLDTDFDRHQSIGVSGIVLAKPNKLDPSDEWIPSEIEIKVGDLVWYNWHSLGSAYDDYGKEGMYGNRLYKTTDGNVVIAIPYYQLFCRVEANDVNGWLEGDNKGMEYIKMLNGYVLIEPEYSIVKSSLLDLDLSETKTECKRIGIVRNIGKGNICYPKDFDRNGELFYPTDEMVDININDRVLMDKECNIPLEWDNQTRRAGSIGGIFFRVQRRNISLVLSPNSIVNEVSEEKPNSSSKKITLEDAVVFNIEKERKQIKDSKTKIFI